MPTLSLINTLAELPATEWDVLSGDNPFVSHAFLSGLERFGCLRPALGWTAQHAVLFEGNQIVAAAPAYLKYNSHGEFVFDHAWARAFEQYDLAYYPKWLCAVPYSPITGPRLLASHPRQRQLLLEGMLEHAQRQKLSSLHFNFIDESELATFDERWLARCDVQFHWQNHQGWKTFDDFLGSLSSKKRKNIRAEREQVRRAGITFRQLSGTHASANDIADLHHFYCQTQFEKGNQPVLTTQFFQHLTTALPTQTLLVFADRGDQCIAGAFFMHGQTQLYGRYWGANEVVSGLHFETCYYQGIDYCLATGLTVFEPGAQGEHKVARGFDPVLTHSRHWIADSRFATALSQWCQQETESVLRYRDHILDHSAFRVQRTDRHPIS